MNCGDSIRVVHPLFQEEGDGSIPMNTLDQINAVLKVFNHHPVDLEDDIFYMRGDLQGYSIQVEDREYEYECIAGKRKETAPHFIVLREYVEHNYPHEPDYVDVAEVSAHFTVAAAVTDILHRNLDDKIEGYYETINEYEMEQHYAEIMQ